MLPIHCLASKSDDDSLVEQDTDVLFEATGQTAFVQQFPGGKSVIHFLDALDGADGIDRKVSLYCEYGKLLFLHCCPMLFWIPIASTAALLVLLKNAIS